MAKLRNNRELYDYMVLLGSVLKDRGATSLGDAVEFACGQATSASTEFLGESRIALKRVAAEENGVLTDSQRAELFEVLRQIEDAFGGR